MSDSAMVEMLEGQIGIIEQKIDSIHEKVSDTCASVAAMKARIDMYLGNERDGEFQRLQSTVREHDRIITRGGVYAGMIAAIVSFVVTFIIATHDHWLPHMKSSAVTFFISK